MVTKANSVLEPSTACLPTEIHSQTVCTHRVLLACAVITYPVNYVQVYSAYSIRTVYSILTMYTLYTLYLLCILCTYSVYYVLTLHILYLLT